MLTLVLIRGTSTDDGTFGELQGEAFRMLTGELPWRDNLQGLSCIPKGSYTATPRVSPKFGRHFILSDTSPRSYVLTHTGNFCGNKSLGKKSDVLGCILVGLSLSRFDGQKVITRSREAMLRLLKYTEFKPFTLEIR